MVVTDTLRDSLSWKRTYILNLAVTLKCGWGTLEQSTPIHEFWIHEKNWSIVTKMIHAPLAKYWKR